MMETHFRRYVLLLAVFTFGMLLTVGGINVIVDPYGVWRLVQIHGFNAAKSERRDQAHLFKAADIRRIRPQVLALGSSRIAYGIDPAHPALAALGRSYNAATPGGHLRVARGYLELALSSNPGGLREVILGVDFFDFGEARFADVPGTFREERTTARRMPIRDLRDVTFSMDALLASGRTILSNLKDPAYEPWSPSGQLTAIDMRRSVERGGMERRFERSLDLYLNGRAHAFRLSESAFAELARIVDLCAAHGVRLTILVPPTHAAHLEAVRHRGRWGVFEEWKTRLAAIGPFWDFSGYNSVTSEPLAFRMSYYWDISHFRSEVGDWMLARMFDAGGAAPADFGVYVSEENVAQVLAQQRAAYPGWQATASRERQLVAQVAQRGSWVTGYGKASAEK